MVALVDCGACPNPLAQFPSMVCRTVATLARSGLCSGLWLHFCDRPLICSASLHTLYLFSVLSPPIRSKPHEKENRCRQLEDEHDAGGVGAICRVDATRSG